MAQILIKLRDNDDSTVEYAMIEVQGDLESTKMSSELRGFLIGDLHFTKEGATILIIGHHMLYGKCVDAEKPLLVMRKLRSSEMRCENQHNLTTEYYIKAVVKKKFIFKIRPKPIITNLVQNL